MNPEREAPTTLSIGADGIRRIIEAVTDNMTYERTLMLMAEIAQAGGTGDEDTMLDRILWAARWAYISGYHNALEVYDEAIKSCDSPADKLAVEIKPLTDEEYTDCVERVRVLLKLTGRDKIFKPRRVYNGRRD